jgi:hypothetical protein
MYMRAHVETYVYHSRANIMNYSHSLLLFNLVFLKDL